MSGIPGMLTRAAAAERVDRSERTIRAWQARPDGLRTILGMIPEADLLEYDKRMRASRGRPRKVDPRAAVLADVVAERTRQDVKWGEQNHPDGTGPDADVLDLFGELWHDRAADIADRAKMSTDEAFAGRADRPGSWADILLEEVFEALAEDDPARLRAELVQVAAVAVQWVEAIDRRAA